jgi:hypothetical protein
MVDIALLVLAVVAAAAAVAAAWFSYPTFRDMQSRPRLVLTARASEGSTSAGAGDCVLELELTNLAKRSAAGWKAVFTSTGHLLKLDHSQWTRGTKETARESRSATGWEVVWEAQSGTDVISENLTRQVRCVTTRFPFEARAVAQFVLSAERMKPRTGRIEISWANRSPDVDVSYSP